MRNTAVILLLVAGTVGSCDKLKEPRLLGTAFNRAESPSHSQATGDAMRGSHLFAGYGCTGCHTIPGVEGAEGLIGPPLQRMARRGYVGGVVRNTPENLVRWIQDPPGVDPMTAMPNLRVKPEDARDMAAYLYTLR